MRPLVTLALLFVTSFTLPALDLDVTLQDVERALAIARSSERERSRFHAPYIQNIDTPFVERAEIVSEYRRIVLLAEERIRRGDRLFAYSVTNAAQAADVWKRRVALVARLRFHPQNTYVSLPDVQVTVPTRPDALVGVLKDPVHALPPGRAGERVTILGATVEAVFDAAALGQGTYTFAIRVDGREVGAVTFDLARLE